MSGRFQQGFTIVELMISIAVFSVILAICSAAIITIGRQYQKASVSATTQNVTRGIMDEIVGQVQLGGEAPRSTLSSFDWDGSSPAAGINPPDDVQVFCIGKVRFSYRIGWQVDDGAPATNKTNHLSRHGIWRDIITNEAVCVPANLDKANPSNDSGLLSGAGSDDANGVDRTGRELLANHTRLLNLGITPAGVTPELKNLYNIDVSVLYGDDATIENPNLPASETYKLACLGDSAGGAFCAQSELHTTVIRRIN